MDLMLLGFPDERIATDTATGEMYMCRPMPGFGAYIWERGNGKLRVLFERAQHLSVQTIGPIVYEAEVDDLLHASSLIHAFIKGELT